MVNYCHLIIFVHICQFFQRLWDWLPFGDCHVRGQSSRIGIDEDDHH